MNRKQGKDEIGILVNLGGHGKLKWKRLVKQTAIPRFFLIMEIFSPHPNPWQTPLDPPPPP